MSEPGMNGQSGPGQSSNDNPSMTSPGARLAAYREERGWTVEQVASQLNLAPRQIIAIESDDYPALPGMPIVRGFVRAYAKLLKVDAAPLLASLGGETVLAQEPLKPRKNLATPFSDARLPSMNEKSRLSSRWVVGLLLIVLLAAIVWAVQQQRAPENTSSMPLPPAEQTAPVEPGPAASAQEQAVVPPAEAVTSAPLLPSQTGQASQEDTTAVTPSPGGQPEAEQASVSPPTELDSASSAAVGKDTLLITAREESWIEIRRVGASNAAVSRVLKPGKTASYEVTAPVSVVVGNARGVDVQLRGTPMELKAGRNNVARVNLK